jgi:rhodanese-related sulfurtransferase|tara:strand:+ start:287 stop:583 length:297 start_codon:yes stop_codon:yes gene_type:complete
MTALELKEQLDNQANIQVIDLREPYEHEDGFISEINIPLAEVMNRVNELDTEKSVILYCNSGKRSKSMIFMLEKQHGLNNIAHLEGGYESWLEQVEFA